MSEQIPNIEPIPVNSDHKRLKTIFDELRKNQLTFLNEAGKRVIELSTGMLGILFAVFAFGKDFPPPYLQDPLAQIMAVLTLLLFMLALLAGVACVQPQEYRDFPNNLSAMQDELAKAYRWKTRTFQIGSILFGLGAVWLVGLIISIIF